MDINIVNTDATTLQDLVDNSALTIEGLALDSIPQFVEWIEEHTPLKNKTVYVTEGALANREWGLTGSNAYPNDLHIVSVKLDDMEDWKKIVMARFQIDGRWMDDIYDNNIRREGR